MGELDGGDKGQGNTEASDAFKESLGDDLKGNEVFKGMENVQQLGSKHAELNTKNTELTAQHEQLKASVPVIPKDVGEYVHDVPEGFEVDEAGIEEFKKFALEKKLTAPQYKEILGFVIARDQGKIQGMADARDATIKALKTEMGVEYEANLLRAQTVLTKFGDEEYAKAADVANNPTTMKFLLKVREGFSEDTLKNLGGQAAGSQKEIKRDEAGAPLLDFSDMDK